MYPLKPAVGLRIEELRLALPGAREASMVLDGVSLEVMPGKITGLAGESGSGKTMTGLCILGLQPPQSVVSGRILYNGSNLLEIGTKRFNQIRGLKIAMILQDPSSAFHPMIKIGSQVTDHYRFHKRASRKAARERAVKMFDRAHVTDPDGALEKYPHQFSGGQLQRIAIGSAFMCEPEIIIADEPTTALDVTVQAGILRVVREMCDDFGVGVLLITHDLGVMSALADEVIVLRGGVVVEVGDCKSVILRPRHPYTKSLIDSLPGAQLRKSALIGSTSREDVTGE